MERERERKRKKKKRRRGRRDQANQGMELWILYGNHFEYGSNLGYELYYESHGFCMGF